MPIKATMSNATVSLALINLPVDLVPVMRSKAAKRNNAKTALVCPTCQAESNELHHVSQQYACSHDSTHGPFGKADTAVALEVDGELTAMPDPVAPEDKPVTERVPERNRIELTIHPADEVEAHTWPSGNLYQLRCRELPGDYALMAALVADRDVAFLCEVTNKGATLLYRLVQRDGVLVLTELVRPEQLHPREEAPDVEVEERLLSAGREIVRRWTVAFDPDVWADRRRERLMAMAERLRGQAPVESDTERSASDAAEALRELVRRSADAAAA